MIPWRPIVTVAALTVVAVVGLSVGSNEIAFLAVGALAGYLGKVNGRAERAEASS